ncbi:MAG: D-aminopeptidase [Fimbriimonadaceae bacterium]|nr:D-aminopeptidase [Fimbriimonadaceae bacterium]
MGLWPPHQPGRATESMEDRITVKVLQRVGATIVLLLSVRLVSADRVDDIVSATMKEAQIPGLSVIVTRQGKVIKHKAYGMANLEVDAAASTDSVFEIGSVTKQFTSVLVMQEVEKGALKLDESIASVVPELPEGWKAVTLRQCLTHTGGLPEYLALGISLRSDYGRAELIEKVGKRPLDFEPGLTWSYSNTGYFLAGMALEEVTGKEWKELVQSRIFDVLGMKRSFIQSPFKVVKGRASGYTGQQQKLNSETLRYATAYSAGAILSTTGDLAKWDAAQGSSVLLSAASWRELWTPIKLNSGRPYPYGLGWAVEERQGQRCYSHGGNTFGFSSMITKLPEHGLSVIALANAAGQDLSALTWEVAKSFLPSKTLQVRPAKPIEIDRFRLSAIQSGIEAICDSKPTSAALDPEITAMMKTSRGRAGGPLMRIALGRIVRIVAYSQRPEGKDTWYEIDVVAEKETLPAKVLIGSDNRLVRFDVGG